MQTLTFQQEKWQGSLRRKVGNAVDAAKLAQDAFLRLLAVQARRLMPVQGLHEPRAYLATGARRRRRRLKHLRRQSPEQS